MYKKILGALLIALALPASAADIVIGQVAPLSGPLAPTGSHLRAGAQLYFDAVNAKVASRHKTQYFEMMGQWALYDDGWLLSTKVNRAPWQAFGP